MSSIKPIKIYSHLGGPNPLKVEIILEELGLPYEQEFPEFMKLKESPFVDVNPNGRLPAIEDPNTGLVIWESGAIIEYLIESYDQENKLNYPDSPQKWLQSSFLFFQMSGQGPYYGQFAWFTMYHQEKLPSVIERYEKEIKRVLGVLDAHLAKTKQPYLIGEKCSYVDLMFIPWNDIALMLVKDLTAEMKEKYPTAWAWHEKLTSREGVKAAMEKRKKLMEAAGGQHN